MSAFDAGNPITSGDLIEDGDGAPLPHELQRSGRISLAVYDALERAERAGVIRPDTCLTIHEEVLVALAPILWPLLPSSTDDDARCGCGDRLSCAECMAVSS